MANSSGLNIVQARGKWYVYTRDKTKCLVKGFLGTRQEIDSFIKANIDALLSTAVENEALRLKEAQMKRARHRRYSSVELHRITLKRCKQKNIPFDITVDQIHDMLFHAGDECEVSRLPFDYGDMAAKRAWHKNPFSPSLDRIDRALGYRVSNVRVVCTSVNIGINEWGLPQFLKICRSVAARDPEIVLQTDRFQSDFISR